MNDDNAIKALTPITCPHCSETIVVEFGINASMIEPEEAKKILDSIEEKEEKEPKKDDTVKKTKTK